jgi:hypothetical protein
MFDLTVMVVFSILNMIGIIMWSVTGLMAMDIVWGSDIHELNFRKIFTRNICVWFARLKRRLKIDNRYGGSILIFLGAIVAILMKMTELREVADYTSLKVCGRVITSLLLPTGIVMIYRASGYKNSFLK